MTENNTLIWLQNWYLSQCNDLWEHAYGIRISTVDNPGWRLTVDLKDTDYESASFTPLSIERDDDNWIQCWIKNKAFEAAGGPLNLSEMVEQFQLFIESNK